MSSDSRLFASYIKDVRKIKRRHILISCIDSRLRSLALRAVFRDLKELEYVVVIRNPAEGNDIVLGFPGLEDVFRSFSENGEEVFTISDTVGKGEDESDIVISPNDGNVIFRNESAGKKLGDIFQEGSFVFPNFPAPYFSGLHPLIKSHFIIRYLYPGRARNITDVIEEATGFALVNSDVSDVAMIRSDFTLLVRNMVSAGVLRGDSVSVSGPKSVSSFERRFLRYYFRKFVMPKPSTLFDYEVL